MSTSMRIGYVLKMYPRFSETFIVNEILAHEAAGCDIDIISLRAPIDGRFHETLARVRAPVTYLPYYNLKASTFWSDLHAIAPRLPNGGQALLAATTCDVRDVHQALLLADLIVQRGITHLHAHFASVATTVARLAALLTGVPFTFTAHAKDLFHESVDHDDLRQKVADAAGVITVSDFNAAFLHDTFGIAAERVVRIYNGMDLAALRYQSPADRPQRIVAVGRLIEKKGFADLVAACALLKATGRQFSCAIVGAGERDQALREEIVALGVSDCVELLGPQPQSQVHTLIQSAAVFAAPCVIGADGNRDGLPSVLLEAMSLGTPCVSTDVTGIPEVLQHRRTGLMVAQHDQAALADAMARLLDNPPLRAELAANARTLIERQFDIDHNTRQIRALWQQTQHELIEEVF